MKNTETKYTVQDWATYCAKEAIKAGGSDPFDSDGNCLLSEDPMRGDWESLEEMMGRKPTAEEEREFARVYSHFMRDAIEEACSK